MPILARLILTMIFGLMIGGCQSNKQVEDRLVLAFEEAMFDSGRISDTTEQNSKAAIIARFSSPVRVSVIEGATMDNQDLARLALDDFAAATGVTIVWREPGDRDADLLILFSDEKEFVINGNERGVCFASLNVADNGFIRAARVHVSRKDDDVWRTDCLVHELIHAFGWRGHTHRIRSANSYMHDEHELTKWDKMLMRTLYDPRLSPGTPREDAVPKARVILRELLSEEQG